MTLNEGVSLSSWKVHRVNSKKWPQQQEVTFKFGICNAPPHTSQISYCEISTYFTISSMPPTHWFYLSVRNRKKKGWKKIPTICEKVTATNVTGFGEISLKGMTNPDYLRVSICAACKWGKLVCDGWCTPNGWGRGMELWGYNLPLFSCIGCPVSGRFLFFKQIMKICNILIFRQKYWIELLW